jgi:hypothetical protein
MLCLDPGLTLKGGSRFSDENEDSQGALYTRAYLRKVSGTREPGPLRSQTRFLVLRESKLQEPRTLCSMKGRAPSSPLRLTQVRVRFK